MTWKVLLHTQLGDGPCEEHLLANAPYRAQERLFLFRVRLRILCAFGHQSGRGQGAEDIIRSQLGPSTRKNTLDIAKRVDM